jgi:hypothetical protein
MLSHTIDLTQRGDESRTCSRLSNYESDNRVPRNARFRRQAEEEEAAASSAQEQKSEEANSDLLKDTEQVPVGDTEKGSQSSAESSENTSKHVPKDTDEPKEDKQQAEVLNKTAEYVFDFL